MSDQVRLADVNADNWRAVTRLQLTDEQKHLVASNVYSIAQSKFEADARPRAVYAGDTLVGFIMYDVTPDDAEAFIYRFMIDQAHQNKGYGRAALACAIEEIRHLTGIARIGISYMKSNPLAKDFYASFGFVEAPDDGNKWGEMHAELKL
jgi:diamine N-acetyltransferase